MKILWGLIGLIIFAVSLPAASETFSEAENPLRIAFFNKLVPNPTCKTLTETQKISFIKAIEVNHLQIVTAPTGRQFDFITSLPQATKMRLSSQVVNSAAGQCNSDITTHNVNTSNAAKVALATAAAVAAYNYANQNKPGTGTGNSSAASLQRKQSDAEIAKLLLTTGKEAQADLKGDRSKGSGSGDGGSKPQGKSDGSGQAASTATTTARPEAANGASAAPTSRIQTLEDGSQINFVDRTIKVPMTGDPKNLTTFKQEKSTGDFVSSDGSMRVPAGQMAGMVPPCATDDCSKFMREAAADPQTAGSLKELTSGSTGKDAVDATSKAKIAQTANGADLFIGRLGQAAKELAGTSCSPGIQSAIAVANKYKAQLISCGEWQGRADTFCSVIRSPKAKVLQKIMSVGTVLLSRTSSASEGCSAAQKFSTIAQQGLTIANLTCTGLKFTCDATCGFADGELDTVAVSIKKDHATCISGLESQIEMAASSGAGATVIAKLKNELIQTNRAYVLMEGVTNQEMGMITAPKAKLAECDKYEADIFDMGLQILSTADATKQAKACREKLGNGGGGGGDGSKVTDVSMDEFCKIPGQAVNPPCLCRTQPGAQGCPGHVADSLAKENTNNSSNAANGGGASTMNTGGASAMATPGGINGMQTAVNKKSGLSAEAKAALGVGSDAGAAAAGDENGGNYGANGSGSGTSSGGGEFGGGSGGGRGSASDTAKKAADANGRKTQFGQYESLTFGGGGGSYGGFGADGKSANGKKYQYTAEQVAKLAERKIASEEFHQQVTTAAGKTNWDKVRVRYDENRSSLFSGQ